MEHQMQVCFQYTNNIKFVNHHGICYKLLCGGYILFMFKQHIENVLLEFSFFSDEAQYYRILPCCYPCLSDEEYTGRINTSLKSSRIYRKKKKGIYGKKRNRAKKFFFNIPQQRQAFVLQFTSGVLTIENFNCPQTFCKTN